MVVKLTPCCGARGRLGYVFQVTDAETAQNGVQCRGCGSIQPPQLVVAENGESLRHYAILASRLKKIDPPAIGEYDSVPVRKKEPVM